MKNTKPDFTETPYVFREGRENKDQLPELFDDFSGGHLARYFNSKALFLKPVNQKKERD